MGPKPTWSAPSSERGARLGERAGGPADEELRADEPPRLGGREILVPDVDPVRAGEEREVRPVVHEDERPPGRDRHHLPREAEHLAGGGILETHLDDRGAALDRGARLLGACDDRVQPAQSSAARGAIRHGGRVARA